MRVLLFGPGFCGKATIRALDREGVPVDAIGREAPDDIAHRIALATHIVSTVPPGADGDPILLRYEAAIAAKSLVYISSTGVYGDAAGGWVDEAAPLAGRRAERIAADRAWLARGATVLRLPGIYGPGRSVVDRLIEGKAHRVDLPGQVFSRIHVEDVADAVLVALRSSETGAFNIADDLPGAQSDLVAWAASRLGIAPPPLLAPDRAGLSSAALAFYAENRRVANGRAKRLLGWRPRYPDYRSGLRALIATTRPSMTSAAPPAAVVVQR